MFRSLPADLIAVIFLSTLHLRVKSGRTGRAICSLLLLGLIALVIDLKSLHLCDEGGAPWFIRYGFGALGAALPWVMPSHPWLTRVSLIPIILVGVFVARHLTASYHSEEITGNPLYSRGRFWHTPFTGQYLRELKETRAAREAEIERLRAL